MTAPARPVLTEQQRAVLLLVASGRTYRETARELGIGPAAVANRMEHAMRRLQASTAPHAVLLACQAGLLDGRPQRHGDHAGYEAHIRHRTPPCASCRTGERAYRAGLKARQTPQEGRRASTRGDLT